MPTGWRPADVAEKFPVFKIEDVYNFAKYDPVCSRRLQIWSWIQLFCILLFISFLFANIAAVGSPAMFVYGFFIFLQVYALTDLADRNFSALFWETGKNIMGIAIIYKYGSWFGLNEGIGWVNQLIICYFIVSNLVVAWLVYKNRQEDQLFSFQAS